MAASFAAVGMLQVMILFGGGMGLPLGIPPMPEDAYLAQAAPEECLFYVTWAGMAAPDAKSKNQTELLLAEPEVQYLITEIEARIKKAVAEASKREGPEAQALAADATDWVKLLLTRPTAAFLSSVRINPITAVRAKMGGGPDIRGAAIVNLGDDAARVKAAMLKHQKLLPPGAVEEVKFADETWYRIQVEREAPPITWGVKGKYFIVGVGPGEVEGVLRRGEAGKVPAWLSEARNQLPVERRSMLAYIDIRTIVATFAPLGPPEVRTAIDALGLGNVASISSVSGLDETGFVSKTLVAIDGEPRGILKLASEKPLTAADLAPIPADSTIAWAARVDADKVFETIITVAGSIEPRARAEIARNLAQMEQGIGISLRDDLLKTLGDTWCVYNSPGEGGLVFTGLTAVVQVKDAKRLAATHEKLMALAKAAFEAEEQRALQRMKGATKKKTDKAAVGPEAGSKPALSEEDEERAEFAPPPYYRRRPSPRIEQIQFAGKDIFFLNTSDGMPFAPAWCLTEKEVIVALFPQNVKAYLARDAKFRSLAAAPEVATALKAADGPLMLGYCDTPKLFELFYPFVPMIGQAAMGEMRREGIDLNVAMIPSAKAIAPHMTPSVMSVRRTKAGIEMSSHQTLPGGGMMLPMMSMPMWLFAARSESRAMHAERAVMMEESISPTPPRRIDRKVDKTERIEKTERRVEKTFAPRPEEPAPPRPR
jgi:hypothetical protein